MGRSKREAVEFTYPLRTAARLTGLSPERLRDWERRHGVVEPLRTPGGTRRYSTEDLERLRLLKAAVDAGNRISQVARLELGLLMAALWAPAPIRSTSASSSRSRTCWAQSRARALPRCTNTVVKRSSAC